MVGPAGVPDGAQRAMDRYPPHTGTGEGGPTRRAAGRSTPTIDRAPGPDGPARQLSVPVVLVIASRQPPAHDGFGLQRCPKVPAHLILACDHRRLRRAFVVAFVRRTSDL
jgi:hypothetical protein